MTDRSLDELDNKASQHRSQLAGTLSRLLGAVDPARNGHQAVSNAASLGHDLTNTLAQTARRNPVALTLVGTGLALLATKTGQVSPARDSATSGPGFDDRLKAADQARAREARLDATSPYVGNADASRLEKALDAGLDRLGPKARERVIAARRKAIEAQNEVERHAARLRAQAARTHHEQPLTTGLLAVGLGAVIGGLLPSTKRETELMGAKRDQLFRHAEAMLHEELAALEDRANRAVDAGVRSVKQEFRDESDTRRVN